jgi:4'-phosphopantetheinyl transferase
MGEWQIVPREVHCWTLTPADFAECALWEVLCADERRKASRFHRPADRTNFVVCRGVLRQLLAYYGAGPAARLPLEYSPNGKPRLPVDKNDSGIEFNISHTLGMAAIAIGREYAVGVDVERIHRFEGLEAVAARHFSAPEAAHIERLPEAARLRTFFTLWTRNEALLKATGQGLSGSLAGMEPALPSAFPAGSAAQWTVADMPGDDGMIAGAAAVLHPDITICFRPLLPGMLTG